MLTSNVSDNNCDEEGSDIKYLSAEIE
ncbi:hypothetical protein ACS0PU_013211 [Formica fusca]